MESEFTLHPIFGFTLHRHIHRHLKDHFIPHEGNNHKPHVLHHRALFLYSALLILIKLTVLASPFLLPYNFADSSAVTSENVVVLTNQSREDYGLETLRVSPQLSVAATNKARDMMSKAYFAHYSPEGISPWFWIKEAGYEYTYAGENLAIRFTSAEGVNEAWLASPAHRANILSKDFSEIGVAVLTDQYGEEGPVTLVVQMFGTSPTEVQINNPLVMNEVKALTETIVATQEVANAPVQKAITNSEKITLAAPEIIFPLLDSYVNKSVFKIIGRSYVADTAEIFIDNKITGNAQVSSTATFEYFLSDEQRLAEGPHTVYAKVSDISGNISGNSKSVDFLIDTLPPEVLTDKFFITPVTLVPKKYNVTVAVSEDSVRTLAIVGSDSVALEKGENDAWAGELQIFQKTEGQNIPIEIFAQDMAGNEEKKRVGWLSNGSVKGVFNFVEPKEGQVAELSLFSGLITVKNPQKVAQTFYLYFVVFLTSALILKIAIKRHIQHPKTIVGASAVAMLAMILFAL